MNEKLNEVAEILERIRFRADGMDRTMDVYETERVIAMLGLFEKENSISTIKKENK